VTPTPDPGEPMVTVIAPDGANIRTGPGTEYPIIGTVPQSATAISLESALTVNGWPLSCQTHQMILVGCLEKRP